MRIRQQLRLYAASSALGIPSRQFPAVEAHKCLLNRSPWDVVDFVFESHLQELQEEEEDEQCLKAVENGRIILSPEQHPVAEEKGKKSRREEKIISCLNRGSSGFKCGKKQNKRCRGDSGEKKISPLKRRRGKDEDDTEEKYLENERFVTIHGKEKLKQYSHYASFSFSSGKCRRNYCNNNSENKACGFCRDRPPMKFPQKTEESEVKEEIIQCRKPGSKGWKCWREAKEGHSFCEHHLALYQTRFFRQPNVAPDEHPRNRVRKPPTSAVTDFYYYSGFGPRWRKRKGMEVIDASSSVTPPPALPSPMVDAHEDNRVNDDEEENIDCKKKTRKPMEARSLKSLL